MSRKLSCTVALFADLHWQPRCRDRFHVVLFYLLFTLLINQVVNVQLTVMLLLSNYILPVQLLRVELSGSHKWSKN